MKTSRPRGGRRSFAIFLAFVIGLAGIVVASPAARADEVAAIESASIKMSRMGDEQTPIYVWDSVRIDADWSIPDGTGKAGDTFKIVLPKELGGAQGSFDLQGHQGDPLAYGTCQVSSTDVVCTFNANVENKNNVGGSLWIKTQVGSLTTVDKLTFETNGGVKVEVPLPNGQQGIDYKPYVPTEIDKSGWFPGSDHSVIHWRIVVPGATISDRSSTTITDNYAQAGANLTVVDGFPKIFWIPATPKCWNELEGPECRNVLDGASAPSVTVNIDDEQDRVVATISNGDQNFQADRIYVFDLELKTDGDIPVGSQYVNVGIVDGILRTARAEKDSSGGGTGAGDTVGHVDLTKVVTGGTVDPATVYPVTWSYEYKGSTRTGELSLTGDGKPQTLRNIPNDAVVTFTEKVPAVAGVGFGDPVFSGDGVTDGVPDANSAQVTVKGLSTVGVTLTNPVSQDPVLGTVQITPGVCLAGQPEASEPSVEVGPTEGITYSTPEITRAGDQVTITVTATPESGRKIDGQSVPEGWVANGDGTYTFTRTITQPSCDRNVILTVPSVNVGVCPVDSVTLTQPTVTGVEDTEQVDYGEPEITINGNEVTATVTATAKAGYRIDTDNLPLDWSVVDGVVTYSKTLTRPTCVVPAAPQIEPRTCPVGSPTPTDPTVTIAPVEGLEYSAPRIQVRDGKVTIEVTATTADGYQIGGPLPEGWTKARGFAIFSAVRDQAVCGDPDPAVTVTPTPPNPSSTSEPARVTPVRPGLPRTGS